MKYLIARAVEGISLNGNEYLMEYDNKPFVFNSSEEAQKHIDDNQIGPDAFVWETESVDDMFLNTVPSASPPDLSVNVFDGVTGATKMGK